MGTFLRFLRLLAMAAVIGSVATLEYEAGQIAGWSWWQSAAVPVGFDAMVLATLLSAAATQGRRVLALGFVEATVLLSVVAPRSGSRNVWLGAGLATMLVVALWLVDGLIGAEDARADALTEARGQVDRLSADLATVRADADRAAAAADRDLSAARGQVDRLTAELADTLTRFRGQRPDTPPASAPDSGPGTRRTAGGPGLAPVDATVVEQVAWVRSVLASRPDTTARDVGDALGLDARTARRRLQAARGLHAVHATEATS